LILSGEIDVQSERYSKKVSKKRMRRDEKRIENLRAELSAANLEQKWEQKKVFGPIPFNLRQKRVFSRGEPGTNAYAPA
jgi:hypothetical protein